MKEDSNEFQKWLTELRRVYVQNVGVTKDEVKINSDAAYSFFKDGYSPYYCFREAYQNDGD